MGKRAGGVDDRFSDGLAVDYDFLDQARRVQRFNELERRAWNGLFPAGTTREVDLVTTDRWTNNTAGWLDTCTANRVLKPTPI